MDIQSIHLRITLEDGQEVEALLSPEGIQRWGNDLRHVAACVDATEALQEALADCGAYAA